MTDNNTNMAPDSSPGDLSRRNGVRRVNNRPMYILLFIVGAFLLVMMLVASDRAEQQTQKGDTKKENAGSTSMFADEIAGDQLNGYIAAEVQPVAQPLVTPPLNADQGTVESSIDKSTPIEIARPNRNLPPEPPRQNREQYANNDDAQRIRQAKLQMLQEAIKAKTGVQATAPRSSSSNQSQGYGGSAPSSRQEMINQIAQVRQQASTNRSDPTSLYQEKLRQIESKNGGGGSGNGSSSNSSNSSLFASLGNNVDTQASQGEKWSLDTNMKAPNSSYEIRTGFVLPATLISGINSELPGQIVAQISQDVSDTATGRHLLIPQGSRLVGQYSSDVSYGQERVLIAWNRIIFPDGKALDIGSMTGADAAGYSGFKDQVNNHYFRIFGSAVLMSAVTAAVTLSQGDDDDDDDSDSASDALSEALGQNLGQVTVEMIRKNMNISPTLNIRPGYRFNVMVTKDMTFSKPYSSFDY